MPLTAELKSKNGETFSKSSRCYNCLVFILKAQARVQIPLGPPPLFKSVSDKPHPSSRFFHRVAPPYNTSICLIQRLHGDMLTCLPARVPRRSILELSHSVSRVATSVAFC